MLISGPNSDMNNQIWLIIMSQQWLMNVNKNITVMKDMNVQGPVDTGAGGSEEGELNSTQPSFSVNIKVLYK